MNTSSASTMMICPECQLTGGPFLADEATLHLTTHNRFHHAGAPTAQAMAYVGASEQTVAA